MRDEGFGALPVRVPPGALQLAQTRLRRYAGRLPIRELLRDEHAIVAREAKVADLTALAQQRIDVIVAPAHAPQPPEFLRGFLHRSGPSIDHPITVCVCPQRHKPSDGVRPSLQLAP